MFIQWPDTVVINGYNSIQFNKLKIVFVPTKDLIDQNMNDETNITKLIK